MKTTPDKSVTAENLEAKFAGGEDVLDYFDTERPKVLVPCNQAGATCIVEGSAEPQIVVGENPVECLPKKNPAKARSSTPHR